MRCGWDALVQGHMDLEKALDEVVDQWAEEPPKRELKAELLVRNRASRMLHLLADESGNVLTCGRMCTKNYDKVAAKPAFMYPMCTRCFSAVQVAEAGDGADLDLGVEDQDNFGRVPEDGVPLVAPAVRVPSNRWAGVLSVHRPL